jgi:hypothetical protein
MQWHFFLRDMPHWSQSHHFLITGWVSFIWSTWGQICFEFGVFQILEYLPAHIWDLLATGSKSKAWPYTYSLKVFYLIFSVYLRLGCDLPHEVRCGIFYSWRHGKCSKLSDFGGFGVWGKGYLTCIMFLLLTAERLNSSVVAGRLYLKVQVTERRYVSGRPDTSHQDHQVPVWQFIFSEQEVNIANSRLGPRISP